MIAIKKNTIILSVIIILVAAVVLLLGQYYIVLYDLKAAESTIKTYRYNEKIINFTKLFITKVLKADGEVSFEDRLKLENAIRDIDNKPIFDQWQKFVNAQTQFETQIEVKNLLELLVNKIIY